METFSALLVICAGNSPVPGEFPAQRPVARRFGVFFDLRLNKRLSKQSWGWRFEILSRPLWRHCNECLQWQPRIEAGVRANLTAAATSWGIFRCKIRAVVDSSKKTVDRNIPNSMALWAHVGPTWSRQDPRWANVGPTKFTVGDSQGDARVSCHSIEAESLVW